MEIKIKYLNEHSELEIFDQGDWIDLKTAEPHTLKAGEHKYLHLGVAMQLPEGYEAIIAPRSSTFRKYGILQTNSIGVVDNSYCGDNDWWMMAIWSTQDVFIPAGERIAQFRIQKKMDKPTFTVVDTLGNDDRNGFGSTDKEKK